MNFKCKMSEKMKLTLHQQECIGNSKFDGQILFTRTFEEQFSDKTTEIIMASMTLILSRVKENIADYLQVLTVQTGADIIQFWVIDDGSCVTFLLPEDY